MIKFKKLLFPIKSNIVKNEKEMNQKIILKI